MDKMNDKITALVPTTLAETKEMSKLLSLSNLLSPDMHGKEANVFVAIVAGRELGLAPMASLRGIHVVKGKSVLAADAMVGVVLGSGLAEYFVPVEQSITSVTWETKRRGSPHPTRCTWTTDDAKRAGLTGNNWSSYPRAMLNARCKSELARLVYPDILAGCYEESEREEIERSAPAVRVVQSPPVDVIDAEIVESKADESTLFDRIRTAPTMEALKALAKECAALPENSEERSLAKVEYRTRMDQLAKASAA